MSAIRDVLLFRSRGKESSGIVTSFTGFLRILCGLAILSALFAIATAVRAEMTTRAAQADAMSKARRIYDELALFAMEEEGVFPTAEYDSNAAFRQLHDRGTALDLRNAFYVPGCASHHGLPRQGAETDRLGYEFLLERGENHWAYVRGLNTDSEGYFPIIADCFSEVPGVYSVDKEKVGGLWERKAAIVIRVDGSSRIEVPNLEDGRVYENVDAARIDIFGKDYLPARCQVLNPL